MPHWADAASPYRRNRVLARTRPDDDDLQVARAGEAGVVLSAFTSRLSARGSRHLAIRRRVAPRGSPPGVAPS
jgi:hypothetical protein